MTDIFPSTPKRLAHYILFKVIHLTFTFFVILMLPLLLLTYIFLQIYRSIIAHVAKLKDPKLGEIVSPMNSPWTAHHLRGKSYIICYALHLNGRVKKEVVIKKLEESVLNVRTPNGNLLYPELQQRIVSRLGYTFWENVDNFRVADHVTYFGPSESDPPITKLELRATLIRLTREPLSPQRSPWEILVVQNFSDEDHPEVRSALIFRLHHCLFDGFGIFKTFGRMTDKGFVVLGGVRGPQLKMPISWRHLLLKPFIYCFLVPYGFVAQLLNKDRCELIEISRRDFKGVMNSWSAPPLKLEEMKAVKTHFGVSFSALQSSLVLGAIKKLLDERKMSRDWIKMLFPIPADIHSDKLENHFSAGLISVRIDQNTTERLHEVQNKLFKFSTKSGLQEVGGFLLRAIGSLPFALIPDADSSSLTTTVTNSSFPGPVEVFRIFGLEVADITVAITKGKSYPFSAFCLSYAGNVKFTFSGDASALSLKDVQYLTEGVQNEFAELAKEMRNERNIISW